MPEDDSSLTVDLDEEDCWLTRTVAVLGKIEREEPITEEDKEDVRRLLDVIKAVQESKT